MQSILFDGWNAGGDPEAREGALKPDHPSSSPG